MPGDGLEAAGAGRDRRLARDAERADVAAVAHVRATAEFLAELTHLQRAHRVAVFLPEERDEPLGACLVELLHDGADFVGLQDLRVDFVFDALQLLRGRLLGLRVVEAKTIGRHLGAGLAHVVAEHLLQRRVQQVGRRVVALGRAPRRFVDLQRAGLAGLDVARRHHGLMQVEAIERRRVLHVRGASGRAHRAAVAHLATTLRVERRGRRDQHHLLAGLGARQQGVAFADHGLERGLGAQARVADERPGALPRRRAASRRHWP